MAAAEAKLMGCKEVHPAHVLLACMRLGQEALDGKGCPAGAASEVRCCNGYRSGLSCAACLCLFICLTVRCFFLPSFMPAWSMSTL
jgi:hypothetical protein